MRRRWGRGGSQPEVVGEGGKKLKNQERSEQNL